MKKMFLFSLMLFCASSIYSRNQSQNVDSLINVLEKRQLTSKEKINLYYEIVDSYILFDLNKASEFAEKGLKFAEKEGDKLMESKFNAFFGRIYNTKSTYDTAFLYWDKALNLAIAAKDKEQEASVYEGIGILYGRQEQQPIALEYFIKSLSIVETIGNKQKIHNILVNIGVIYKGMDNFESSLYNLEKARILAEELNDDYKKMITYFPLSEVYFSQKNFDPAFEMILKAYEISKKIDNQPYQAFCSEVLSSIYYEYLKDYDTAWKYANEFLQFAQQLGDPQLIAGAWKSISNVYRAMGQYKECESAAKNALEVDSTNINLTINIYENIVLSNIIMENKANAEKYFHRYIETLKEHVDLNNREISANIEAKYETEKKEIRIASLEKEQQLYIWLGSAGVLFAIALGIMLWLSIRNARKEKQLIATRSVLDGEMGERSRLARDLHDRLSGNLSAVKMGIKDNRESILSIHDKLDKCIEEIRRVAHNLMPASLQFGLKVALGDFALQFQNVQFHFFGEEKRVEGRIEFVAYCCASELVNNSIRHSGAKNINLQLIQSEKHISITVQDDGCGFDENSVKKGFGMKSIRDRVASCNGKVDVSSSPGKGTETSIELKIESKIGISQN